MSVSINGESYVGAIVGPRGQIVTELQTMSGALIQPLPDRTPDRAAVLVRSPRPARAYKCGKARKL